jgi:hypothetical protein
MRSCLIQAWMVAYVMSRSIAVLVTDRPDFTSASARLRNSGG